MVGGGGEEERVRETLVTDPQIEVYEKSGGQEQRLLNDQMTDRADRMTSTTVGDENTCTITSDDDNSTVTSDGDTSTMTGGEGKMNSMAGEGDLVTMTGDHTTKDGGDHVTSSVAEGDCVTTTLSDKYKQMPGSEQSGVTDKIDQHGEPNTDTEEGMGGGIPAGSTTEGGGNVVPKDVTSETAKSERQNLRVMAGQKAKEELAIEQETRGEVFCEYMIVYIYVHHLLFQKSDQHTSILILLNTSGL